MNPKHADNSPVKKRTVSIKKVEANRRNALKSTGPKTPRGKVHSRRNAIKHGLFIRAQDEHWDGEDPRELQDRYNRLRSEWRPVGPCEEMEVEHIAICWLRLQRLWRYENAEVSAGNSSVSRNQENGRYSPVGNSPTRIAQISMLRNAEMEAEASGQVSAELMKKIFAENLDLQFSWPRFEAEAEKTAKNKRHDIATKIAEDRKIPLSEAKALLVADAKSQPERKCFVAAETVREAMRLITSRWFNQIAMGAAERIPTTVNSQSRSGRQNHTLRQRVREAT